MFQSSELRIMPSTTRNYRSAVMIIQLLLEELTRVEDGMVKSDLYKKIGLKSIDLQKLDEQSSYAVIGLWFHKLI